MGRSDFTIPNGATMSIGSSQHDRLLYVHADGWAVGDAGVGAGAEGGEAKADRTNIANA
jgi:hypothetical protein